MECTHLKHSCQQLYHNQKIFTPYGACAMSCTALTTTAWKKEVNFLQFQKSAPPPLLGQCPCRYMLVVYVYTIPLHVHLASWYTFKTVNLISFDLLELCMDKLSAWCVCSDRLTLGDGCKEWFSNHLVVLYTPSCLEWSHLLQILLAVQNSLCTYMWHTWNQWPVLRYTQ